MWVPMHPDEPFRATGGFPFLHFPARGGLDEACRPADLALPDLAWPIWASSFQLLEAHHATVGCFCWQCLRAVTPSPPT